MLLRRGRDKAPPATVLRAELRLRRRPGDTQIPTPTPHAAPRRNGVLLYAREVIVVALVVFVGGDLCIPLANQLGVHKQAIHIHVGQGATVPVASPFLEFEPDGLAGHQTTVGFKSFPTAILGQLVRVVGFWSVEASVAG
jgi:hypothetical protein